MSNLQGTPVPVQDTKWTQKESIEKVKTLTIPYPSVREEPTLHQISSLNPQAQIGRFQETPTTR